MSRTRAVFLDLHGTLGDQGEHGIAGFSLYPAALPALQIIRRTGLLAVLVTNQSRIGRGEMTHADFASSYERLQIQLDAHGCRLDAAYYCPHTSEEGCD
jgi:histidinol phosphatase-like enzyme